MYRVGQFGVNNSGELEEDVFGSPFSFRVAARMIPYVFQNKRLLLVSILALSVFVPTQVAIPWVIKVGIDEYIRVGDFHGLTLVAAVFFGIILVNAVANAFQEVAVAAAGQKVLLSLRRDLFGHLQKQTLGFHERTEVGRIMSRVQGDVYQIQEVLGVIVLTLADLLSLIGYVVMILVI